MNTVQCFFSLDLIFLKKNIPGEKFYTRCKKLSLDFLGESLNFGTIFLSEKIAKFSPAAR